MKRFLDWIRVKMRLDASASKPPLVSEREVWWASIGENVSSEIGGKSTLFTRPVIILKKLSHGFYFVVPTSTKIRDGTWYVPIRYGGYEVVVCLHQARAIDYRRLSTRLGQLDDNDFKKIRNALKKLLKL